MNKKIIMKLQSILVLILLLPLASCGQKGPLTMPEPTEQNENSQQQQQ